MFNMSHLKIKDYTNRIIKYAWWMVASSSVQVYFLNNLVISFFALSKSTNFYFVVLINLFIPNFSFLNAEQGMPIYEKLLIRRNFFQGHSPVHSFELVSLANQFDFAKFYCQHWVGLLILSSSWFRHRSFYSVHH